MRSSTVVRNPRWPMIVFRHPEGLDRPAYIDGKKTTGRGGPSGSTGQCPRYLSISRLLADWLASYRPDGTLRRSSGGSMRRRRAWHRQGALRMSDNPHANGGLLLKDLRLPDFREYGGGRARARASIAESTRVLGRWLTDVVPVNPDNFRIFGPDETASNRCRPSSTSPTNSGTPSSSARGRRAPGAGGPGGGDALRAPVPGLARGLPADRAARAVQLLRGLHPHHRLDGQPARQVAEGHQPHSVAAADRQPDYLLSSHASGVRTTTVQPSRIRGFIDHVVNKRAEVVRSICRRTPTPCCPPTTTARSSRQYVNVVVRASSPARTSLDHGPGDRPHPGPGNLGVGTEVLGADPDVVIADGGRRADAGGLAPSTCFRQNLPELKIGSSTSST